MITKATSPNISPREGPRGGSSGGSPSSVVALLLSVLGCQPSFSLLIRVVFIMQLVLVELKVDSLPGLSLFHLAPVFCWPSGLSAVVNAVSPSKSNVAESPCISYCTTRCVLEDNNCVNYLSLSQSGISHHSQITHQTRLH